MHFELYHEFAKGMPFICTNVVYLNRGLRPPVHPLNKVDYPPTRRVQRVPYQDYEYAMAYQDYEGATAP